MTASNITPTNSDMRGAKIIKHILLRKYTAYAQSVMPKTLKELHKLDNDQTLSRTHGVVRRLLGYADRVADPCAIICVAFTTGFFNVMGKCTVR